MSNCTQTLLVAPIEHKAVILAKLAEELPKQVAPYVMDNWGLYPKFSKFKNTDVEIRIGSIETDIHFMVRASHPNCPPNWYVEFAKSLANTQLLYQDLDGYGENTTWDLADETTEMSKGIHTYAMNKWYKSEYTKFTNEFVGFN